MKEILFDGNFADCGNDSVRYSDSRNRIQSHIERRRRKAEKRIPLLKKKAQKSQTKEKNGEKIKEQKARKKKNSRLTKRENCAILK